MITRVIKNILVLCCFMNSTIYAAERDSWRAWATGMVTGALTHAYAYWQGNNTAQPEPPTAPEKPTEFIYKENEALYAYTAVARTQGTFGYHDLNVFDLILAVIRYSKICLHYITKAFFTP